MIYVQQMAKYTAAFRCKKFQRLSQTQQGRKKNENGLFTCDVAMRCTWGVFRWEFTFVDITCVCSSPNVLVLDR
jgi:hypothetical protein